MTDKERGDGIKSVEKSGDRRYISFFSGALGLDLGFERAGYDCMALNEIDPITCKTIRYNRDRAFSHRRDPHLYDFDIRHLTAERLCDDLHIVPGELFAVVGGPPCQAFSTAGRRLGLNDERGNVFFHFVDLIGKLKPKYAVFENVRGLLSAPLLHRPHNERGAQFPALLPEERPRGALLAILARLASFGYKTTFTLYNTANFGVPQIRERLIFFASREGEEVPFMVPTHNQKGTNGLKSWETLDSALCRTRGETQDAGRFPEKRLKYYRMLSEGQNWKDLPQDLQKDAMGKSWHSGGGKTGFYRRLSFSRPSPTLVTSPTMPATDLCHPSELRPLSVQEYAAIQTYPEWFTFAGRLEDRYRQLGNAVPCRFGSAIAMHLAAFEEGRLHDTEIENYQFSRYRGTDHESWREMSLL